ncbi:pectin lyase fold/virulence factor [Fimicolochytrium jonesii]|uniref:pectin lyase fold/virulence factor n=1 Tax=Fimicolochytrium jonesii TaxID=1396493 RepID=UPI0022FEBDAB|nr:pectin lyase fold/virulence factor [Fimicolochytrium jonesii]KAI8825089.1 pectin lyase fold/virulence factor [Fimicolochytrium jonesii]
MFGLKSAVLACLCAALGADALTTPPAGALIVSKTSQGNAKVYSTVSAAVAAAPAKAAATIFVYPGTYNEQVHIKRSAPMTIIGYSKNDVDYKSNEVLITYKKSAASAGNNDASGTVRAQSADFSMYNINIQNEFVGSQAIALSAQADRQGYYGCQLLGWQDTLLTNQGHHYFGKTKIVGRVDYIFGSRSRAYFQKCDMRSLDKGWVTASGVDSATNKGVYVFNQCTVAAADNALPTVNGGVALGRPWRQFAHVVFMNSDISNIIKPTGWDQWNPTDPTQNLQFFEYNNMGTGSATSKRILSRVLAANEVGKYSMANVLESTNWVDKKYI